MYNYGCCDYACNTPVIMFSYTTLHTGRADVVECVIGGLDCNHFICAHGVCLYTKYSRTCDNSLWLVFLLFLQALGTL